MLCLKVNFGKFIFYLKNWKFFTDQMQVFDYVKSTIFDIITNHWFINQLSMVLYSTLHQVSKS